MTESQILQLYNEADAFLNVTGAQELRDEHLRIPRRIYVESDPFASQVKVANGDKGTQDALAAHDTHFTFGENIGAADCSIPSTPFKWMPTRQPVSLELWATDNGPVPAGRAFNTITTWHNKGKNVQWRDDTYYWTKDREFLKFVDLPLRRPGVPFELAVGIDETSGQLLRKNGWRLTGSVAVSADIHRYRDYIRGARGEFTVARDQYVRPCTGWFSDRSACYLAAGLPVVTQETGFSTFLPAGKGLFGFTTIDDVLAAVDAIESDWAGHCRAARDVAAECFAAEKVLGSLMDRAGL
jgi:hypothetical protein